MQLTTRNTETFVRRFASASKPELQQCANELGAMGSDFEQSADVRQVAKELATVVRRQIKKF